MEDPTRAVSRPRMAIQKLPSDNDVHAVAVTGAFVSLEAGRAEAAAPPPSRRDSVPPAWNF
jgi:hypothetical protein